jgi:hypothetical protein
MIFKPLIKGTKLIKTFSSINLLDLFNSFKSYGSAMLVNPLAFNMKIKEKVNHLVKLIFNHLRPPLNFLNAKDLNPYLKDVNKQENPDFTNKLIQAILNQEDIGFSGIDSIAIPDEEEIEVVCKDQSSLDTCIYNLVKKILKKQVTEKCEDWEKTIGTKSDAFIKEDLFNNWSQLKSWEKDKFNQYFKKIDSGNKAVSIENLLNNLINEGMDGFYDKCKDDY